MSKQNRYGSYIAIAVRDHMIDGLRTVAARRYRYRHYIILNSCKSNRTALSDLKRKWPLVRVPIAIIVALTGLRRTTKSNAWCTIKRGDNKPLLRKLEEKRNNNNYAHIIVVHYTRSSARTWEECVRVRVWERWPGESQYGLVCACSRG